MLFIVLFLLLLSSVETQYYYQQQQRQYPYNNYNQWSPYSQYYSLWNQGIQQSKSIYRLIIYYIKIYLIRSSKCSRKSS